ncbi:NAD-dependent epimerase/dehydratase family protein [Micromonospora sp. SL1-18]|uniref:NAD-dependent epimerase/dehydratase family protein n=1 Tax=Micromonospora sp. SL1-18 TaxID=3399128 RepID=UPI003A4E0487
MHDITPAPVVEPTGKTARVLIIGATGYIGSAVAEAAAARGHEVVALARRGQVTGYRTVSGDLTRPDTLAAAVNTVRPDAIIHAGNPTGDVASDLSAMAALLDYGAALIYTSGIWWLGAVGDHPFAEDPPVGDTPRARIERMVLAAADRVRTVVIRPAIVYGRGGGIPAEMIGWACRYGIGRYVGMPGTRWPAVHVDDLAALFVKAVERAEPGAILHGVGEEGVPVADIAAAADIAAGGTGRTQPWPVTDAAAEIGEQYARWLALDQVISSTRTRETLDWRPGRPSLVEDIAAGSYRSS